MNTILTRFFDDSIPRLRLDHLHRVGDQAHLVGAEEQCFHTVLAQPVQRDVGVDYRDRSRVARLG